jgi:hypothetical protein
MNACRIIAVQQCPVIPAKSTIQRLRYLAPGIQVSPTPE